MFSDLLKDIPISSKWWDNYPPDCGTDTFPFPQFAEDLLHVPGQLFHESQEDGDDDEWEENLSENEDEHNTLSEEWGDNEGLLEAADEAVDDAEILS